jgi:hypothetical protein
MEQQFGTVPFENVTETTYAAIAAWIESTSFDTGDDYRFKKPLILDRTHAGQDPDEKVDFKLTVSKNPKTHDNCLRLEGLEGQPTVGFDTKHPIIVRPVVYDDKVYEIIMPAAQTNGIEDLKDLAGLLIDFGKGNVKTIGIQLTAEAIESGWKIIEEADRFVMLQVPAWTTVAAQLSPSVAYFGREVKDIADMSEADLYLNNCAWVIPKARKGEMSLSATKLDSQNIVATYHPEENGIQLIALSDDEFDPTKIPTHADFPCTIFTVSPHPEVDWGSELLGQYQQVPPTPVQTDVYSDDTGRSVTAFNETYMGMSFDTYILTHGDSDMADRITMGAKAIWNEQLIHVLKHRYTALQAAIPHEANVKTLALLDEILAVQASRYSERADEGKLGTTEA